MTILGPIRWFQSSVGCARTARRPAQPRGLALCLLVSLLGLSAACTRSPEPPSDAASTGSTTTSAPAAAAPPSPSPNAPVVVTLSEQKLQRAGIVAEPAAHAEFRSTRDFPGTVEPNQHALADITALVRGRVIDVYGDLGKQVASGEILAVLYSSDLGMAQSSYLKAKARLFVAERASQRAQALLQEKVIGIAEAQRREGDMISARADEREARDRLKLLGMTDDIIKSLDRDQQIKSYIPIVSPFAGRIIARDLTKGEVVETTARLFQVADLSQVWVTANIPERDIPFIHSDQHGHTQKVEVHVKAYPDRVFPGAITYVGDVLDPATRTMRLRIELPNEDGKLKPQMFATVRVYGEGESERLTLPEGAIQRDRERQFVFIQRDAQTFELRDVQTGDSNGQRVTIMSGVQPGDMVVTKGAFVLKSELFGGQG